MAINQFSQSRTYLASVALVAAVLCGGVVTAWPEPTDQHAALKTIPSKEEQPLPGTPAPPMDKVLEKVPGKPASRSFWVTWRLVPGPENAKAVGIVYRSIEGGPFVEVVRSAPGATAALVKTEELGKKHCYHVRTFIGSDAAEPSKPFCQIILPVPQAEDVRAEPDGTP